MNVGTGTLESPTIPITGLLEHDESNGNLPLPDDYMSNDFLPRKSEDKSTNPYGSEFLSLVLNNNLIILNGRTLGDLSGSFTFIKPNGSSVVDYLRGGGGGVQP